MILLHVIFKKTFLNSITNCLNFTTVFIRLNTAADRQTNRQPRRRHNLINWCACKLCSAFKVEELQTELS